MKWRLEPHLPRSAEIFLAILGEMGRRAGPLYDEYNGAYLAAAELLAAGQPEDALRVQVPENRLCWPPDRADFFPRLSLVRARAFERLGRRVEGVRELDGLMDYWRDADADLPLLVEAKALRSQLADMRP